MWSSAFWLSLSTVFAIVGLALVSLAVSTDNWYDYQVNRREIINAFNREAELNQRLKEPFTKQVIYFSRSYGLFQICFPETVPSEIGSFNKFGSPCIHNTEYFPSDAAQQNFTQNQTTRLYLMRATVILYVVGIACVLLSFLVGVFGCWRRSSKLISITAFFLLFSVMFLASGMVCWHVVSYMEWHMLESTPFYKTWEPILKSTTARTLGYSYIASWAGIAFLAAATLATYFGRRAIKKEIEMALCAKSGAYMLPNYYDKSAAMVPYGYNTYGGYGGYPYYNQYNNGGYYGYMTYGR